MDFGSVSVAYLAIIGIIAGACVIGVSASYHFFKNLASDIRELAEKTEQEEEQSKDKEDKAQENEKTIDEMEKLSEGNEEVVSQPETEKKSIKDFEAAASLERQNSEHANQQQREKFNNEEKSNNERNY